MGLRSEFEKLPAIADKLDRVKWHDSFHFYHTSVCGEYADDVRYVAGAWMAWQTAKANAVPETLKNDCMIGQNWFMKGSPVAALIKHAEDVYKAEVIAQNSKIKFGTDDNEHWFAHDVPFYGTVQIDRIEEHGLVEWDIYLNDCWQGPFNSKSECIKHLEECILEARAEAQEPSHDGI